MASIRCAHCKGQHSSVAEVRACSTGNEPLVQRVEREAAVAVGIAAPQAEGLAFLQEAPASRTPLTDSVIAAHRSIGRVSVFEASPAQVRFVRTLNDERDVPVAGKTEDEAFIIARLEDMLGGGKHVSAGEASAVITWLKTLPMASAPVAPPAAMVVGASPAYYARPAAAPLPDVPEGHYAVTSRTGNNDLDFFRVDRPTEGRWAGRTFVKRVIGGKPDHAVRGAEARTALEAIVAAGVQQAGALYGQEIGRCYRCNRHLTDETSRALGIGPDCRSK